MERRCHLNQPLHEHLLRLLRPQPHAFPCLMSGKELACMIESQAFSKGALGPIEFHPLHPTPHANIVGKDVPADRYESSLLFRAAH